MRQVKKSKILFAAMISLGMSISAFAEVPVIEDISKNSYNVIRHLARVNETTMSLASAEKIKRAVMADKVLDTGEKQMLQYLIDGQGFIIKIPTSTVDAAYSRSVSAEAKSFLQSLLNPQAAPPKPQQTDPTVNATEMRLLALKKATETGNADSQYKLGKFYNDGNTDFKYRSTDKAIYWYKKASAQGHSGAQYELAGEYSYGRHSDGTGLDRSSAKSFELYKKAAAQDHAGAMVQIASSFMWGRDGVVEQSPETAAVWNRKAADLGDHWGMQSLGVQYLEGKGIRQSEEKAIYWLKKSYALGNETAEDILDDLDQLD